MTLPDEHPFSPAGAPRDFATTRWTLVVAAGDRRLPESERALNELCQAYWYPLYCYVRRQTGDAHKAQDLTQEFFARLLSKNQLAVAEAERGKFRAFLMTSLKNFLTNQWQRDHAEKRGGMQSPLSLDFDSGESRYHLEPADRLTPEMRFERDWALTLLEQVLRRLREEFAKTGKETHFERLKSLLGGYDPDETYAQLAAEMQMTEGALKTAVHRFRKRYRELLRAEVAQTVASPEEVDEEIRRLFGVLAEENRNTW